MSQPQACPHAETTTLLWLYGEAPEEHVHHVASCVACQAVAELHADVAAQVLPVADALVPAEPSVLVEPEPLPEPANRGWLVGVTIGLVAAAAVLLALFGAMGLPGGGPVEEAPIAEAPAPAPSESPRVVPDPEPAPVPEPQIVQQDPPSLDEVDPELLREVPAPVDAEDERVAEALLDQAFGSGFDDELQDLFDDFDALEADLTTL